MPFAFTELGVAMLSGLLNSEVAINVNISVMCAFVTMRNYVSSVSLTANHQDLVLGLRNSGTRYFFFFVCQFYLATNDLLRIMILSGSKCFMPDRSVVMRSRILGKI